MKFFKSRLAKLGMAIAWVAAIGGTQAYNVGDYIYVGPGAVGANAQGYLTVAQGSYADTTSAAVQNSTVVTERRVLASVVEAQTNMVLSQISDRFEGRSAPAGNSVSLLPQNGGNAGSMDQRSSVWARAGYDNLKEDSITTFGGWKANLWSFALGYDYKFNDKVLFGAALTYSNLNGSTAFNKGNIRDNAYGITPYLAFKVSPCFDVDVMLGYSRVNKNRSRTTPGTTALNAGLTGPQASSSPKSDRYFGAVFANYKHHVNRWNLLARLGYLYMTDRQKSFNETNGQVNILGGGVTSVTSRKYGSMSTNLSRLSLRLQAGYKASQQVEPYAFLTYARDFGATKINVPTAAGTLSQAPGAAPTAAYTDPNKQRSNNTFGGGLGLNACLHSGWSTGAEASYAQSKKFKDIGIQLRLSKKF